MDRFGYCKLLDKSTYERNQETVDTEQVHVLRCLNTDKICLFTSAGVLHQIKALDIPSGKLRDKGVPIENLSKYDGRNETICLLTTARELKGRILLFATRLTMVKQVPGEEFETNNRMVAATKLPGRGQCGFCNNDKRGNRCSASDYKWNVPAVPVRGDLCS